MSSAADAAAGSLVTPKRRRDPLGEVSLRGGSSNKASRADSGVRLRSGNSYKASRPDIDGSHFSSLIMPTRAEAKNRSTIYSNNRMTAETLPAQAVIVPRQLLNPDQSNLKGIKDGYYARRWAIYYLFALFGFPEREFWTECGLVHEIISRLSIPTNSWRWVVNTMENILDFRARNLNDKNYDPNAKLSLCGVKVIIEDESPSASIICTAMENSNSVTMATYIVNLFRSKNELPIVCRGAV